MKIDYKIIISVTAILVSVYLLTIRDILGITYKRYIRSGDAHYLMEEYNEAKSFYIKAFEVRKNDEYAISQIKLCKEKLKIETQNNKNTYIDKEPRAIAFKIKNYLDMKSHVDIDLEYL